MLAHPNGVVRPSAKEPLFSFGVIADVQYADIPDGRSFLGVPRYYRHSIAVLRRAVQRWNGDKSVRFCINFGDIVDGFCPKDRSLAAVQAVVREFDGFRGGLAYHMLGNHCLRGGSKGGWVGSSPYNPDFFIKYMFISLKSLLISSFSPKFLLFSPSFVFILDPALHCLYNLPRSELVSVLRMPSASPGRAYYDFSPWPGYRFVVLDAYDFSAVGWPRGHPVSFAARRFLEKRNPNHDKNSPSGLAGTDRRFVMFNGGVGDAQLRWLDGVLRRAARRGEKAVVCSHLPVHPGAASPTGLMWNYEEVMDVVRRHGGCVVACLAGHDHKGGYAVDDRGVHHRTMEAALECPPGTDAFGHVEVYPDRPKLVGSDRMASTEMLLSSSNELASA